MDTWRQNLIDALGLALSIDDADPAMEEETRQRISHLLWLLRAQKLKEEHR